MSESILEIQDLCKSFGKVRAVDHLSFQVKKGEFFAFLGVNGAGKSTTISILCGQLPADSGRVRVCSREVGKDRAEIARKVGVVFQSSVLDFPLSVRENLLSRGGLYGISRKQLNERIAGLAAALSFTDILDRPVGKLSGGQRRRIDIARALLHSPEILILDEPTTGLDPQTRKLLWSVISRLQKEREMTVFLTTHYMEEAADADSVVILDAGKICAEGTPIQLKNQYTGDYISFYNLPQGLPQPLQGYPREEIPGGWRICVKNPEEATRLIVAHPECFTDYEVTKGKMDDVFLAVTGKKLTGGGGK